MHPGPGWRGLTWGLVAVLLLEGCATVPQEGVGGSGWPTQRGPARGSMEWESLEEARRDELESAVAGMWGVASEVREVGAVLEFSLWAEGGALTLLSLQRREWGREPGGAVDPESFSRELREILPMYLEGQAGVMRLMLRREERRWRADYQTEAWNEPPPEARTWPVRRRGVRHAVLEGLLTAGREVASRVWAPVGAQVRWSVEVSLEDERVWEVETMPPHSFPGGTSVRSAPETVGTLVNVLVPFSQGLGPRKVRMELEGTHVAGTRLSRWKVVAAEIVRPTPPAPENADVVLEYRAMHERIQREWREETREGFQQMGLFSLEQMALWVVGGLAARGVGVVVEAAAPTIARVLASGGSQAAGWVRSLLARAAPSEKQLLARLMAKAETQGVEALTAMERTQIQTVLAGLEKRLAQPLTEEAKRSLRAMAKEDFYTRLRPDLAEVLVSEGRSYPIHHKLSLEFAHLFPGENINAGAYLVAVSPRVHSGINSAWNVFRSARGVATPQDVLHAGARIDAHFGRWYNRLFDSTPASEAALSNAEAAAMKEMKVIVEQLLKERR